MFKWITGAWGVINFLWEYIRPVYVDLMRIIAEVRELGLEDEAARKKVFQDITDCVQARGLQKIPDSVMNASIELCYQIYMARKGDRKV